VRIAWFSPLPPTPSGIADYSFELLPALAERSEVHAFCPQTGPRWRRSVRAPLGIPIFDPARFEALASQYDAVFYHLGNNPFHAFVYRASLQWPGIAVLHELVLHHLIEYLMFGEGRYDISAYRALLESEYSEAGTELAHLREVGAVTGFDLFMFPLSGHVLRSSRGAVVHTWSARDRIREVSPDLPSTVIAHHAGRPPEQVAGVSRGEARRRLSLPPDAFLVGQFGFATRPKQPVAVLDGFQRLLEVRRDALLLIVGDNQLGVGLTEAIRRRGLQQHVRTTGYVDPVRFHLHVKAVDAVVNLRYPNAGEASGTFTRALAEGRAAIVNNLGSFAEAPRDVCLKVEVDRDQGEEVGRHLIRLAQDPGFKSGLEARAKAYARSELDPARCADGYLEMARRLAHRTFRAGAASRVPPPPAPPYKARSGPDDAAPGLEAHAASLPRIQELAAMTLPPSGGAIQLDLLYRMILGRPAEKEALRSSQRSLARGEVTRSELIKWMVESPEFRERELIDKTLLRLRRSPGLFRLLADPLGPGTTERTVEIPWVLTRWRGERLVLDLGYAFASALYLSALLGLGIESLHGVDWSAAPAPAMRRVRADLRALPYREGSFDLVLCVSTIEHVGLNNTRYGLVGGETVDGDVAALREVERVLVPGGRLLITVPFGKAEELDWTRVYDRRKWKSLVGATHLQSMEQEIYELTGAGWVRCQDLASLERISYGSDASAARGVLCAELVRPG
jgi:glycosyltransferase involved in cell wall biosynthesis/SAM-dependent methyltransferase